MFRSKMRLKPRLLCVCCVVSVAGCGGNVGGETETESETDNESKTEPETNPETDSTPFNDDKGGDALSCEETPADRSADTPLTVCSRTVPEEVAASISCSPEEAASPAPSGCSAHEPCGAVTGCMLERNETITSTVTTTYTKGPPAYTPPAPPHWPGSTAVPGMMQWMSGAATAWFERPVDPSRQTLANTDQPGSCGSSPVRSLMIAAISSKQFGIDPDFSMHEGVDNYAYWCGACAELVGRSGRRVRVQVVTQCTGCDTNNIDLPGNLLEDGKSDTPWNMIDDPSASGNVCTGGAAPVDWRIVPCEVCGGIVVSYLPGFDKFTPAVSVFNHRLPIVGIEIKHDGQWEPVQRTTVNNFLLPRSPSEYNQPIELRVTAIDGATISGVFPVFEPGRNYEGTTQF